MSRVRLLADEQEALERQLQPQAPAVQRHGGGQRASAEQRVWRNTVTDRSVCRSQLDRQGDAVAAADRWRHRCGHRAAVYLAKLQATGAKVVGVKPATRAFS